MNRRLQHEESIRFTREFYALLRKEVREGNPALTASEQKKLQGHYEIMMQPGRYPVEIADRIYVARRAPAVRLLMERGGGLVLDAGCGFGSESFLFGACGMRVIALDQSDEKTEIAAKRLAWFEQCLGRRIDVTFQVADLNAVLTNIGGISLTWIASVLATIEDQNSFMQSLYERTEKGGVLMVTDMNLANPLFFLKEWLRRRRGHRRNKVFERESDFWAMVRRQGRRGARFVRDEYGGVFDDVQFFTPITLRALMEGAGFRKVKISYNGFIPPLAAKMGLTTLETGLGLIPIIRRHGYFYLATGSKTV